MEVNFRLRVDIIKMIFFSYITLNDLGDLITLVNDLHDPVMENFTTK